MYYVYLYLDPLKPGKYEYGNYKFDYEPFYVGKGKNNRLKNHLLPKYLKNGSKKSQIINNILSNNLNPIILKYLENITSNEAYSIEIDLIEKIGMLNKNSGPLSNIMAKSHGIGCHSAETKEKIRKAGIGRKHTEETKQRFRLNKLGKLNPMYKDGRSKLLPPPTMLGRSGCKMGKLNPMYGKKLTDEQKLLRSRNSPKQKTYEITNKDGSSIIVTGLLRYCRNNNLNSRAFRRVLTGDRTHYKNMTIREIKTP